MMLTLEINPVTIHELPSRLPQTPRSEFQELLEEKTRGWQELDTWLLWTGISSLAREPVSHIGIYTDFT